MMQLRVPGELQGTAFLLARPGGSFSWELPVLGEYQPEKDRLRPFRVIIIH